MVPINVPPPEQGLKLELVPHKTWIVPPSGILVPVNEIVTFDPGQRVPEGETVGLFKTSSPQVIRATRGRRGIIGLDAGLALLGMAPASHLPGSNTTREKISTHVLYINPIIG